MAQSVNWEGMRPEMASFVGHMTKEMLPPQLTQAYEALSPDGPDHLDAVLDKMLALWNTDPAFPLSDLERVAAPALVLAADDDVTLSIEHAAAMQRALPDSQLAVVPGASHAVPMEKPELVNRLILDFLADGSGREALQALTGSAVLTSSSSGRSPCCIANSPAAARLEASIFV